MEALLIVATKLLIMVVMMLVGYFLAKKQKLTNNTVAEMTWILLNVVTPCLIINSFAQLEAGAISSYNMIMCVVVSFLTIGSGVLISRFFFKKEDIPQQKVYRFAMTFSNASFMGIPLVQALTDAEGLIYASIFIAMFNFMLWTFGYVLMSGDKNLSIKKILLNAGTVGFGIGLAIYIPNITLPEVIASPIESISYLNTPLAMFIFGFYIASIDLKEIFTDRKIYFASFLRLILMPLVVLGILVIIKPTSQMFLSVAIQCAAPAATTTVLFSALLGADAKLASKVVTATNLLCLITIPIYVTFVKIIINAIL